MNGNPLEMNRRRFAIAATAVTAGLARPAGLLAASDLTLRYGFCAFTKFLQTLSFDELADEIAEVGFGGVEVASRVKDSCITPNVRRTNCRNSIKRWQDAAWTSRS